MRFHVEFDIEAKDGENDPAVVLRTLIECLEDQSYFDVKLPVRIESQRWDLFGFLGIPVR